MRKPRMLAPSDHDGLYHVANRLRDSCLFFAEEEREVFREFLVAYAGFSGIELAAWCQMGRVLHVMLITQAGAREAAAGLPEEEILRRMRFIYGEEEMAKIVARLDQCQDVTARRRFLDRYTRRMGDLPMYMRTVNQRFARWYNQKHGHKGPLWKDRYQSRQTTVDFKQLLASRGEA